MIVLILSAALIVTALIVGENNPQDIVCTQDVMQCPDGSYVGRTGPNCEFAQCPTSGGEKLEGEMLDTSTWKTYRNEKYGFEVKYPGSMTIRGPEMYGPSGNKVESTFNLGIYDREYGGRVEGEIPQLIIVNYHYGNAGEERKFFTDKDVYSDIKQKLYDWVAEVHFSEWNQTIEAKCVLFESFEADGTKGLPLCNAILSTFKFTK